MPAADDRRRFLANWRAEQDALFLYDALSRAEPNPQLSGIYRRLAETEQKHARLWEDHLARIGSRVPAPRPSWRSRWLARLAKWFGPAFVLPALTDIEQGASAEYDGQPEAVIAHLPQDERSHARIFGYLSRTTPGLEGSAVARLEGRHRSTGGNALRAGVLGANDGLVSNLSLVMGVAGAEVGGHGILITGLAGLLAGAISMALGEWLSVQSSRELYQNQIAIEKEELATVPDEEKEELALIYQAKGLSAEEAERLAEHLLSDPANALDTLSREELGIDPTELGGSAREAALTSFFLFATGAVVPVLPFFWLTGLPAVAWSAAGSALALFVIGGGITLVTGRNLWFSGFRQILFGLAAAGVTFGLGRLIGINLGG